MIHTTDFIQKCLSTAWPGWNIINLVEEGTRANVYEIACSDAGQVSVRVLKAICLELADQNDIKTLALCCISTGVFMFPNQRAAEIAVETVRKYLEETGSQIKVIFNVFKDIDLMFYKYYLGEPEAE